jgi:zinc protease
MDLIRLDNGLKCILDKREGAGVVAMQVWVKVGSGSEADRVAGITHFIEHLIFKGTDAGVCYEIAPKIEAMGGNINAFTSHDATCYHIVMPKHSFEAGFKLLADSVRNPAFPQDELEKEKRVIIEEIKMGEDDPQRKLFTELFRISYPGHPYGRPIIGWRESVSAIGRSDILSYFKEHYTPPNMAVVLVGDYDEDGVRGLLDERLAWQAVQAQAVEAAQAAGSRPGAEDRITVLEKDIAESYLAFSYPIGPFLHRDTPALDVLARVLADGESSRLKTSLKYEKGLATDADSYVFTPRENGLFVLLATFKGRDWERVAAAIDDELGRISSGGVAPWEIEKAKNLVRASYIYGAESVQGKARLIGNFETLADDPAYADKYLQAVGAVTARDLAGVVAAYLLHGERRTAALLPRKTSNPVSFQLDNGLRCIYNRKATTPSFSFMIGFVGGLKEERQGQNGSFNLLARMLLRGTKDLDAQDIARKIDVLAGSISPMSGRNVFGLSGRFLSKDFAEALGLLKNLVVSTVFKEDELKKAREEVLSEIRRRDDDPVQYAFMEMNALLYKGHPYAKDQMGSARDVTDMALQDIEGLYGNYIGPGKAVLALSGDLEPKAVEESVHSLFSDWKGLSRELTTLAYSLNSARERAVERQMYQTHLIFGFIGPGLIDADRYSVEVMAAVLSGMGGRIHRRLREENPYAYALTFFNQEAYEVGAIGIYIGTDRAYAEDVERIAMAEIEQILDAGFTEEEAADAKRSMIGSHYIRMQTNGAVASNMCLDAIYGLQPDFFKVWPEKVEKVSLGEVNAAARKYLLPERMVKLRVGP